MNAEYLMHAPCMRDVQSGYERCAVEYQSHVREHSGNNNNGAGATLGGSSIADDPVENSKKLCWYIHFFFLSLIKTTNKKSPLICDVTTYLTPVTVQFVPELHEVFAVSRCRKMRSSNWYSSRTKCPLTYSWLLKWSIFYSFIHARIPRHNGRSFDSGIEFSCLKIKFAYE